MRRRRQREQQRQQAAAEKEKEDEDVKNVKRNAGQQAAEPNSKGADPDATAHKQVGFLRSISTIFHIRGSHVKHRNDPKHAPHEVGPSRPQPTVDNKEDRDAGEKPHPVEEKKRGSWVRAAFMRRGRKGSDGDATKNVISRGRSEEDAELRSSKELARKQQKEQKQESERKKKQDKDKAKERNKLSRKSSSLLSRMAVSTKRASSPFGSKREAFLL